MRQQPRSTQSEFRDHVIADSGDLGGAAGSGARLYVNPLSLPRPAS